MNYEMTIRGKVWHLISLYTSPNQPLEVFETFVDKLELSSDAISKINPFLIVILGDLNVKLSELYENDSTSYEGTKIDGII